MNYTNKYLFILMLTSSFQAFAMDENNFNKFEQQRPLSLHHENHIIFLNPNRLAGGLAISAVTYATLRACMNNYHVRATPLNKIATAGIALGTSALFLKLCAYSPYRHGSSE